MSARKKQDPKPRPAVEKVADPKIHKLIPPGFFDKPGSPVVFVMAAVIAMLGFIVYRDFLLMNKALLYKDIASDSINASYPYWVQAANDFKNYGSFTWTFNLGMGQNLHAFPFFDPFNIPLFLLPTSKMMWFLGIKEYLRLVVTGILFYFFLRTAGRTKYASMIGAMMYAFCGYMIVSSTGWPVLSFDAFNIVLTLLAFELFFKKRNPWLFPLPIFLMCISNPFTLLKYAIFFIVYGTFRYYQENRKGIKDLVLMFLKLGLVGLIGVIMSAPVLIDFIQAMLESARVSGPNAMFDKLASSSIFSFDAVQFGTGINRFFCTELLGTGSNYKGWANIMEAPQFYCGIPCLLLTPLVFGYLSKQQKILFGAVLGFWLLPFIFPYFRYALWTFTGDYYRTYSVFVSLVFIIFSTIALDKLLETKKVDLRILIGTTIGLLILQSLPYFEDKHAVVTKLAVTVKLYTVIYAAIIFWMVKQKDSRVPMWIFLVVLATELTQFSYISVNRNTNITANETKERTGYNDYTKDALAFIKKNDSTFYRVDKNYCSSPAIHYSLNESMIYDYNGTSCYNSFNQKYYLNYQRIYNIISADSETQSRWAPGLIGRPILQSLNSVKYILAKGGYTHAIWHLTHDSIGKFDDILVLKGKDIAPFGYTYDKYIKLSEFKKLNDAQKDFMSFKAAIIEDEDASRAKGLQELTSKDTILPAAFNGTMYKQLIDSLGADHIKVQSFTRDHLAASISLKTNKVIYLSIPYDAGWHVELDGKPYRPLLLSTAMIGIAPGVGGHTFELSYQPPHRQEARLAGLLGLLLWGGLISFVVVRGRKRRSVA
jgi:uncharacterized membrane protein YfhO